MGIPTVVLQRQEFIEVTTNAVSGLGFSPEIAQVIFPVSLFLAESDLSPVKENIDKFIAGLTKWQPKIKEKTMITPPKVTVEGKDYEEAFSKLNKLFLKNSWSDGLPLLPATAERVKWILRGTDLPPNTKIGKIMTQGRIADVETIAGALAMAGGRPEYLPVLIAAVEGMIQPGQKLQQVQATTASTYPAVIVNGPIAKQIRLNSGFGLLGPDSEHPAGAAIGRAMRLIQQNVGGAVPGVGTMAQFGGMRFTNAVFAEDEDGLPPGWQPLSVEYFGAAKGENTISMHFFNSAANVLRRGAGKETLEEEAQGGLQRIAGHMRSPNLNCLEGYHEGTPGMVLLSATVANQNAELGWTKEKIKTFLWENSKVPMSDLKKYGFIKYVDDRKDIKDTLKDPWPITSKAKNIILVVAGGQHPTHAYWMQTASSTQPVNVKIKLPANWNALLTEAEADLGPPPM
jgi:hypothetical protein